MRTLPRTSTGSGEKPRNQGMNIEQLLPQSHRLMRAQSWPALFAERPVMHKNCFFPCLLFSLRLAHVTAFDLGSVRYGHIVKALMAYVHKVERAYAAKRTLYRGMRLAEYHLTENYVVGRVVTWHAFSNVTTDLVSRLHQSLWMSLARCALVT